MQILSKIVSLAKPSETKEPAVVSYPNAFSDSIVEPITRVELLSILLAGAIRDKPKWTAKINDEALVKRWRQEIKRHGDLVHVGTARSAKPIPVTPEMLDFVFAQLRHQAKTAPKFDGLTIEPAAIPGVFQCDGLVPADLKAALREAVAVLENVPAKDLDWHPDSHNQVLDLIHPSLFCLVFGVSTKLTTPATDLQSSIACMGLDSPVAEAEKLPARQKFSSHKGRDSYRFEIYGAPEATRSVKFQWLPSEFDVDAQGRTTVASYINNLHPSHTALYSVLARLFDRFVPLFESVLTELTRPAKPLIEVDPYSWYEGCEGEPDENDENYDDKMEEWYNTRQPQQPDIPAFSPPEEVKAVSLRNTRLQVIVKIANIILTPENPKYKGGVWHVEGMENEAIVATGIYYSESTNITPSRLAFRRAVATPNYEQNDNNGVLQVFGLENDGALHQDYGSLSTLEDRAIAFPNLYQHRVEPFELLDKTKPGVRKIIVYFLIAPNQRVLSTADIPPQQHAWLEAELHKLDVLQRLPSPLRRMISDYLGAPQPMSLEAARQFRTQLMAERKFIRDQITHCVFERPFSLCEH